MRFLVIVEQGATSWGAHVPDMPGCVAIGESRSEAISLIREAVDLHIDMLKETRSPTPTPCSEGIVVETSAA